MRQKGHACRQAGFIHILLIFLVVIAIGAILFLGKDKLKSIVSVGTPVPSSTDNLIATWKIYEEEKFSIRYPENWYLEASASDETPGVRIYNFNPINLSFPLEDKAWLSLDVYSDTNPSKTINDIEQLNKEKVDLNSQTRIGDMKTLGIIISGSPKKVFEYHSFSGSSRVGVTVRFQNEKDKQIINQILSTFKFTN